MVSAFAAEADSAAVRDWLARQTERLVISDWVVTEFSGALAMKRRLGAIDDRAWTVVMAAWRRLRRDGIAVERVTVAHFDRAALIMDAWTIKLRSADALHLAIAADLGWTVATLDREMAAAAVSLRIAVDTVLP